MLTRGRIRLPRRLIPALMALATGEPTGGAPPPHGLAELERAGLVDAGRLNRDAAAVVGVMTEPQLVVSVETTAADGQQRSTVWATDDEAVWGRSVHDDVYELRGIDRDQLPLLLAQLAGVGRRPAAPFTGSISVPTESMRAALDWRERDPETSLGILIAAGVDPVWADRLLIAHDHALAKWTVSSVWSNGTSEHYVRELTMLDAGPGGYWEVRQANDLPINTYRVISMEETMRRLRSCLPEDLATR